MNVVGDIMFPGGKYNTREGEEKTRWVKCGTLLRNAEGKFRIKLDAIPLGIQPDGGWFSVFEKEPPRQQSLGGAMEEDAPW